MDESIIAETTFVPTSRPQDMVDIEITLPLDYFDEDSTSVATLVKIQNDNKSRHNFVTVNFFRPVSEGENINPSCHIFLPRGWMGEEVQVSFRLDGMNFVLKEPIILRPYVRLTDDMFSIYKMSILQKLIKNQPLRALSLTFLAGALLGYGLCSLLGGGSSASATSDVTEDQTDVTELVEGAEQAAAEEMTAPEPKKEEVTLSKEEESEEKVRYDEYKKLYERPAEITMERSSQSMAWLSTEKGRAYLQTHDRSLIDKIEMYSEILDAIRNHDVDAIKKADLYKSLSLSSRRAIHAVFYGYYDKSGALHRYSQAEQTKAQNRFKSQSYNTIGELEKIASFVAGNKAK